MSIEKLTNTIIESAQIKAKEISHKYEQQIQKVNEVTQQEIQKLTHENDEEVANQKLLIQTRLISNAQLKSQQQLLVTKWEIIESIFDKVKQTFLASEKYINFIKDIIMQNSDTNTEFFIARNDFEKIQKLYPSQKFTIYEDITGGVIIRKGRIELNYSIDKIFESLKSDLVIDLSKLLFE
jgi:V/A-type H+-transporting ATPase subunit E